MQFWQVHQLLCRWCIYCILFLKLTTILTIQRPVAPGKIIMYEHWLEWMWILVNPITLPETNEGPENNEGPERRLSQKDIHLNQPMMFRGHVSSREAIFVSFCFTDISEWPTYLIPVSVAPCGFTWGIGWNCVRWRGLNPKRGGIYYCWWFRNRKQPPGMYMSTL